MIQLIELKIYHNAEAVNILQTRFHHLNNFWKLGKKAKKEKHGDELTSITGRHVHRHVGGGLASNWLLRNT